jgi:transcription elongation factor Elf1
MEHQTQYWITCPECGHQMKVSRHDGPVRAKYCDKCGLLFSFTNQELAVAVTVGSAGPAQD